MSTPKHLRTFNPRPDLLEFGCRPTPSGPWVEDPSDMARNSVHTPKFNGYIFKRTLKSGNDCQTIYVPKVCKCMPRKPKTYGLACNAWWCSYCHPKEAHRLHWTLRERKDCVAGRRGCDIHKMMKIRGRQGQASKPEDTSDAADSRPRLVASPVPGAKAESKRSLRLTKWEESPRDQIEAGLDLAQDEEMMLYADGWRADLWHNQIAFLAQQGLLDDFETGDVDFRLDTLPQHTPPYTVTITERHKGRREKKRDAQRAIMETIPELLHYDSDWDTDLVSFTTEEEYEPWSLVEASDGDLNIDH